MMIQPKRFFQFSLLCSGHQVVKRYNFSFVLLTQISVRKGRTGLDKLEMTGIICIEDPFEISHDLGRIVDKFTIKILREEFERAANILQFDPNPSITLFEPYVPPLLPSLLQEETANAAEIEL